METSARDRILAAAHDLFYRDGIRASGVDAIIAASGVAKLTFYRHFPAKDALVLAYLEMRHDRWIGWFVDTLGRHGADRAPPGRRAALLLVDVLREWVADPLFRGCAFINVVAELGADHAAALAIARRHKEEMEAVIAALLPAGPRRAARARAAAIAFDGAIVQAQRDAGLPAEGAADGLWLLLNALLKPQAH